MAALVTEHCSTYFCYMFIQTFIGSCMYKHKKEIQLGKWLIVNDGIMCYLNIYMESNFYNMMRALMYKT